LTGKITPIGQLQAGGKRFFSSAGTPDLGVHVPTVAVLLDFYGGWRRPWCAIQCASGGSF
jgi:hypothetical protein